MIEPSIEVCSRAGSEIIAVGRERRGLRGHLCRTERRARLASMCERRRSHFTARQPDREGGAFGSGRLDLDPAGMSLHDLRDNVEAEADAATVLVRVRGELSHGLEDVAQ